MRSIKRLCEDRERAVGSSADAHREDIVSYVLVHKGRRLKIFQQNN